MYNMKGLQYIITPLVVAGTIKLPNKKVHNVQHLTFSKWRGKQYAYIKSPIWKGSHNDPAKRSSPQNVAKRRSIDLFNNPRRARAHSDESSHNQLIDLQRKFKI